MKTSNTPLLMLISILVVVSCGSPTSEEKTEAQAEEINEEQKTTEYGEQNAEFVVEAYSFNLMLQEYAEVAAAKEEIPDAVKQYAQRAVVFHENLNNDLERAASANNIALPQQIGANVVDFKEDLLQKEGEEFTDEYLEAVDEIQRKLITSYQDALLEVTDPQLHDWVKLTSVQITEKEEELNQIQQAR